MTDVMHLDDDTLVGRSRAGDEAAVNELCRRARPYCVRLAIAKFCFSPEDAEDIAQEALIRIMLGLRRGYSIRRFKSWIVAFVKYAAIDHFKSLSIRYGNSERRTQKGHVHKIEVCSLTEFHGAQSIEDRLIASITITQALSTDMSPMCAAAIRAVNVEGRGISEHADAIGATRNQVLYCLQQGRKQLRESICL